MQEELVPIYSDPMIDISVFIPVLEHLVAIVLPCVTLTPARTHVGNASNHDARPLLPLKQPDSSEDTFGPHVYLPLGIRPRVRLPDRRICPTRARFLVAIGLHTPASVGLAFALGEVPVGLGL